ncbi:MAG: 4-hydroxy-tetrahydrodipicolinate reductase [Treponema sp.]|jgi:4-hydroxy-tetrahydrodipicolinate reductase|nr:4-hydroxy-tetrahydrodipicolinate reductase [Treponema sp.]
MKAGLIGYGKMGKIMEKVLLERGHEIVSVIDPFETCGIPPRPEKADVFIEFTRPDTALDNIRLAASLGRPIVVGTTGWYDKIAEAGAAVEAGGASLLWAANFSLGVNLFYRIAGYAAAVMDPFDQYDAAGYEVHHNKKADSPSGTAKALVERVLASMKRKKTVVWGSSPGKTDPGVLHYASLRVGSVPGIHSLVFDCPFDTIEISHSARSRDGFAAGAALAAEWLISKKRRGIFTMDDVLKDVLG